MSDRNTATSSLDSQTLHRDTLKPHLQLSAVRSDLTKTLQEQQRAQRELIRAFTQGPDLVRHFQEQQRELFMAPTQGLDMVRQFQEQQSDLLRQTMNPFAFPVDKPRRKRTNNPTRELKALRQENYELQQKNSEMRRQLRRHQRPMLPSIQRGDGEFWMSLR